MEDAVDSYGVPCVLIEYGVRETPYQNAMIVLVNHRIDCRRPSNSLDACIDATQELFS
jgi:hypothetical protein